MSTIIDRRLNPKNKSAVNRRRFFKRYKQHLRKAVTDAVSNRSITDMEKGETVVIPKQDVSEPIFHTGSGGNRETIHPGNKEFTSGDKIRRPEGGGGGSSGGGEYNYNSSHYLLHVQSLI